MDENQGMPNEDFMSNDDFESTIGEMPQDDMEQGFSEMGASDEMDSFLSEVMQMTNGEATAMDQFDTENVSQSMPGEADTKTTQLSGITIPGNWRLSLTQVS